MESDKHLNVNNENKQGSPQRPNSYNENGLKLFLKTFYEKLRKIYMNSPINFSFITGWRYPGIPRLTGNLFVGRLTNMFAKNGVFNNTMAAGKLATNHQSGMCYFWLANKFVLLVTKPEHIHQILINNDKNVSRGASFELHQKFTGSSLLIDSEELWSKKRSVYSNWLTKKEPLKKHESTIKRIIDTYITRIRTQPATIYNAEELFVSFLVDSIISCLFPFDLPQEHMPKILDYLLKSTENVNNARSTIKWTLPSIIRKLLFRKDKYQDFEVFRNDMINIFDELLLKPNEISIKTTENFIRAIWEIRSNKEDSLINSPDIFGDANTLLFAGTDTTSKTFQFTVKLLCANPDVERKLHKELKKYLHEEEFNMDNINKVGYLDRVIHESMRLYPPAALIPRDVITSFKLDELPLLKNDLIIYSPYLTHRLNDYWKNPEEFNPDRFANKEDMQKMPRCAYIPFGVGSRNCIGQKFAMQDLKMFLAAIYLNYHVEVENNSFEVDMDHGFLKPKNQTMIRFIPIDSYFEDKLVEQECVTVN